MTTYERRQSLLHTLCKQAGILNGLEEAVRNVLNVEHQELWTRVHGGIALHLGGPFENNLLSRCCQQNAPALIAAEDHAEYVSLPCH